MSIEQFNLDNNQEEYKKTPPYIYGLIIFTAIAIVATIGYSTYLANRSSDYFTPLIDASNKIRTTSALAHLWTEEALIDGTDIQFNKIEDLYDKASGYTNIMLAGGKVSEQYFLPVKDLELRKYLENTREKINYCKTLSGNRFSLKHKAIAGTETDQTFNEAFNALLNSSTKVVNRLHHVMNRDMKIFHNIQWSLILLSFMLSIMLVTAVHRTSRRKNEFIQTIRDNNYELVDMNCKLASTEQQLRANNQQLMAGEQQLQASNQQLMAGEQQLKAANQQLKASEEQLKVANMQLMANDQQLRATNQQLMASEQALRESENRYRSLFDHMLEGVALNRLIYDDKGRPVDYEILNVNPQFEAIINIQREHLIKKTATEAYSTSEPPFIEEYSKVADTGVSYRFETYFAPLKKHFDISVSAFAKGHFATIFTDITERKQVEEEKLTIQTQIQKLESLGILAGGIAHDFNNLLTGILANINFVAIKMKDDATILERLSVAEKACLHSQDLTKQLLTFSSGGAPVKSVVDPDKLIRESVGFTIRGSNITADFQFTEGLWAIDADEGQINQVISNLSINAMHAMPEGGRLNINAENINVDEKDRLPLKNGAYVKISVEDNGIGISDEYMQKIFDPYFTTKKQGSGLGLAISFSIINKHNGFITANHAPEKGTIFVIYLPASVEQPRHEMPVNDEIMHGHGNILLMDDEEIVSTTAGAILNEFGFDVTLTSDGMETIELYTKMKDSEKPFDLVIMDLTIQGGMGGRETMQKLLEIDPDIKAIVSSGYSSNPIMANFRSYGFMGMLNKPYKVNELVNAINSVLSKK